LMTILFRSCSGDGSTFISLTSMRHRRSIKNNHL
jgi:hypothetical protein